MATKLDNLEVANLRRAPSKSFPLIQRDTIERYSCKALSYNDFYWNYMNANWPVILTEVSNDWECVSKWLIATDNSQTTIDFNSLKRNMTNCRVPVVDCRKKYFNSHQRKEMNFHDFLDYWQLKNGNPLMDVENDVNDNHLTEKMTEDLFYLKDWHLRAQLKDNEKEFYQVPIHFTSDWLNEYLLTEGQDDYRFVYMGPKDTWYEINQLLRWTFVI